MHEDYFSLFDAISREYYSMSSQCTLRRLHFAVTVLCRHFTMNTPQLTKLLSNCNVTLLQVFRSIFPVKLWSYPQTTSQDTQLCNTPNFGLKLVSTNTYTHIRARTHKRMFASKSDNTCLHFTALSEQHVYCFISHDASRTNKAQRLTCRHTRHKTIFRMFLCLDMPAVDSISLARKKAEQ